MTKCLGTLVCSTTHHTLKPKFIHTTVVYEDADGNPDPSCMVRDQWTCAYCGEVAETQEFEGKVAEELSPHRRPIPGGGAYEYGNPRFQPEGSDE